MRTERIQELLAERATCGLSPEDRRQLDSMLRFDPRWDDDGFDLAAAAVDLALAAPAPELPAGLRQRLQASGRSFIAEQAAPVEAPPGKGPGSALPAWLAAAAGLLLALVAWWPRLAPSPAAERPDEPAALQERLSATAIQADWQATEDPAATGAAGRVVWDGVLQRGFMEIRGLAANDPSVEQYQLWIFDRQRDERYPVDGGVFDMPAGQGEVRVPIDAKIAVGQPYLFAVTVERPGGVVVSDRERIVLVAEA